MQKNNVLFKCAHHVLMQALHNSCIFLPLKYLPYAQIYFACTPCTWFHVTRTRCKNTRNFRLSVENLQKFIFHIALGYPLNILFWHPICAVPVAFPIKHNQFKYVWSDLSANDTLITFYMPFYQVEVMHFCTKENINGHSNMVLFFY